MSADVVNMAPQGGSSGKGGAAAADPLDELFPRVEIDGLLKGTTILADAKSDAWKTKKEALETLQAILDQGANKRLKPQMGTCPANRIYRCHCNWRSLIYCIDRRDWYGTEVSRHRHE